MVAFSCSPQIWLQQASNRPHVNYKAICYEAEASPCETKPTVAVAAKIAIQTSFKKRSCLNTSDAGAGFQVTPTYPTFSSFTTSPCFLFFFKNPSLMHQILFDLLPLTENNRNNIELNIKICILYSFLLIQQIRQVSQILGCPKISYKT